MHVTGVKEIGFRNEINKKCRYGSNDDNKMKIIIFILIIRLIEIPNTKTIILIRFKISQNKCTVPLSILKLAFPIILKELTLINYAVMKSIF